MTLARRFAAGLLKLLALGVLLLGSCAIPGLLYVHSPRWSLQAVQGEMPATFFIAWREADASPPRVARYEARPKDGAARFDLPEGTWDAAIGGSKDRARVEVRATGAGRQHVRISTTGNTPWTSISEYEVVDGRPTAMRHAHSNAWILVGIVVLFFLFNRLVKPINRRIDRLVGIAG